MLLVTCHQWRQRQKHDFLFFIKCIIIKTIITFSFCHIQNNQGLSKVSTLIILEITKTSSWPIIVYNTKSTHFEKNNNLHLPMELTWNQASWKFPLVNLQTEGTGNSLLIINTTFPLCNTWNHRSCKQHHVPSLEDVLCVVHAITAISCAQFSRANKAFSTALEKHSFYWTEKKSVRVLWESQRIYMNVENKT